ncbi:hypothetical protein [Streptococcus ruminicola]|uniref:hypothetical protein n=1 Tax=Streptococcus ruminicola TaxID=2686210 RepID=UPI0012F849A1|nr:hypothetical protein [Streptococcus ruminicola]QGX00620.1 hypothetical protein GO995_04895 [Streptococcus ruminicola]
MEKNYCIDREISFELSSMLMNFIKIYKEVGMSDYATYSLYQFILDSYQVPRKNRYSIKLLASILKENHIKVSLIINTYYHVLNCLALNDGLEIYGDGFLI